MLLNQFLILGAVLFATGVYGVLARRNGVMVLMSIELMLNAVNINLVAFGMQHGVVSGQVFALFVIAVAAAEVGVVFTGITLVTGMLWGKVTWGTYWQWDARLTTTVLLFVTYLGYLALRRLPADPIVRSRRAAVMALISFINVPIVHYSVDWWRTLHQKASLSVGRRPEITGEMYWTLLYSALAVTIVAAWLIIHRYRVIRLEELRDEEALAALISSRLNKDDGSN